MNHEFFEALALLEKEKGIPAEYLIEKIQNAISIAIKRDLGAEDNIVEIDPATERFYVAVRKTVVEEVLVTELPVLHVPKSTLPSLHSPSTLKTIFSSFNEKMISFIFIYFIFTFCNSPRHDSFPIYCFLNK